MNFKSLKVKLFFLIVILTVAPLVFLGGFVVWETSKNLTMQVDQAALLAQVSHLKWIIFLSVLLASAIAAFLAYLVVLYITKPILALNKEMNAVQDGDLRVSLPVTTADELGQMVASFNQMVAGFKSMVREVQEATVLLRSNADGIAKSADSTGKASENIARNIESVANTAAQQGKDIAKVSRSIFEVANQSRQVAKVAEDGSLKANDISQAAQSGVKAIDEVVTSMNAIKQNSDEAAALMQSLDSGSQQIGKIVATIATIADQTNLLALNAAIEAARAGEQGRGFAVVADEVRKLAEHSARAAKEIKGLIENIQQSTSGAVKSIVEGKERVEAGVQVVNQAGETIRSITLALGEVVTVVKTIAEKAAKQSENARSVVKLIDGVAVQATETTQRTHEVAAATEETTAAVEEVSSTISEVAGLAEKLDQLMQKFKID